MLSENKLNEQKSQLGHYQNTGVQHSLTPEKMNLVNSENVF